MSKLSEQLGRFMEGSPFAPYDPETGEGLSRGAPTDAELDDYTAPGRPATYPLGVLYRADHETLEDGLCRQARIHARALAEAGVPLMLRSIGNKVRHGDMVLIAGDDVLLPQVLEQVKKLRGVTCSRIAVAIYQTVLSTPEDLVKLVLPGYVRIDPGYADHVVGASVLYTPWERDRVDQRLVGVLNRLGQVWLQCADNVRAFVESGVDAARVRTIPNAYDPESLVAKTAERRPRPPSGRRFYHIGKWEPRKAQHDLIGAFLQAFGPSEHTSLLIKTSPFMSFKDYPTPTESIAHWLEQPAVRARGWSGASLGARLRVEDRLFTDEQMAQLHEINNIYVSSGYAEGWDYPAFDACSAGNRLVYVGYGGPADFALEDDVQLPWSLGPVHPGYRWEGGAQWASYGIDDMVGALGRARPRAARRHPADFPERFGAKAVGAMMRDAIYELSAELRPA